MFEAILPQGVLRDGAWRRDVLLRRPNGADEALLLDGLARACSL